MVCQRLNRSIGFIAVSLGVFLSACAASPSPPAFTPEW